MDSSRPSRASISRAAIWAGVVLLTRLPLAHADEPISTDRPDFVESSLVVGKGRFQIETGFASERNKSNGDKERLTSTPTLLRYGMGDAWELRLETDGVLRSRIQTANPFSITNENGYADVSLGVKWHMADGDESGRPGIAWLLHFDVDSGSSTFRGDGVRPSLRAVAEWELPGDWSVGVMPGLFSEVNGAGQHYVGGIAAVTVGKSWTETFRTFVELSGQQLTSRKNGGNIVTYDAGAAYLLNHDTQIDLAFSWGATRETPDFQWGIGFSKRF